VRIRNITTAVTAVVLYSRYHSRATLVNWLGHVTLRCQYQHRDHTETHRTNEKRLRYGDTQIMKTSMITSQIPAARNTI